jgi:hypothetical protein
VVSGPVLKSMSGIVDGCPENVKKMAQQLFKHTTEPQGTIKTYDQPAYQVRAENKTS